MGQGCSQLQITTRKLPRGCFKRKVRAEFAIKRFPESVFSVPYPEGREQEQGWGWGREREIEKDLSSLDKSLRLLSCNFGWPVGHLTAS